MTFHLHSWRPLGSPGGAASLYQGAWLAKVSSAAAEQEISVERIFANNLEDLHGLIHMPGMCLQWKNSKARRPGTALRGHFCA